MESLGKLQLHHQPFQLSFTRSQRSSPPKFVPICIKSTCISLTTAAALLLANLQLKSPAIAVPLAPPSSSVEHVSLEDEERAVEAHLTAHPSDIDALRSLMEVKIKSRKLMEAVEVIDRLIELEPEESEWPVLKANIFTYSGDLDSAKTEFEEILAKDPLCLEAYHGLLMAYSDSGLDLKEVEKRIQEAMVRCRNNNDFRDFKLLVAQIRVIQGNHTEALKLYQELALEDPTDFRPYLYQGIVYTLLNRKDEADQQFDKFWKLVPEDHPYTEYLMDNMIAAKLFPRKMHRHMPESQRSSSTEDA